MADFSVAIVQRSADNTRYEVQRYDIDGALVTPNGSPIPLTRITQDNSIIIRASHHDYNIVYIGGQDYTEPNESRAALWKLELDTGTLTLLNVFGATNALSTMVTDIVTEHDTERAWILVGNVSTIGDDWNGWSFNDAPDGGLWVSEGGDAATFVDEAHVYPYHGYNINHWSGPMAIAIGEFDGRKFNLHAMTENVGVFATYLSRTLLSDADWADIEGNDPSGTASSNLGSIQYHTEIDPPYVWFSINESGTGTFSFPSTQQTGLYFPDALTWTYPLAANLPTGLMGGLFYLASGRGVMAQFAVGGFKAYQTTDSGAGWDAIHSYGDTNTMRFRGWELHRFVEQFAACTDQIGESSRGFLHWTLDGGSTWLDAELGAQRPLALTFLTETAPPPPVSVAWPNTATWRDARGFTAATTFYVAAPDAAAARTQAQAIVEAIDLATRAALNGSLGVYTTEPLAPGYGSAAGAYQDAEDKAHLVFVNQFMATTELIVPAPAITAFLPDGVVLDPASSEISGLAAAALANHLCNRAGVEVTALVGGYYSRSSTRRRVGSRTYNPALTGPGL